MDDETKGNEAIPNINKEISHCEMLASFLTDEELNDVILKGTDGVEVPANRFLLAARSKVFRAMLFSKFREATSPAVQLGFQGNVLRAVVEYIVTDSAEMLKKNKKRKGTEETNPPYDFKNIVSLVSLMEAASYFHLPELGKLVFALLEHILNKWPSLSMSTLQACQMAGPTIASELTDTALQHVRALHFKMITTCQVSCLSADILETILKDNDMRMTEYELFQILQQWSAGVGNPPSGQSDRHATAAKLSQYIAFEKIDPLHLSTTVTDSGLVTSEKLLEVYKNQALAFSAKEKSQAMFSTYRTVGNWTTDLPPDNMPPSSIKVEGAGSAFVNGVYERNGFVKDCCKYDMHGRYEGNPCIYSICVDIKEDIGEEYWYLSILDRTESEHKNHRYFYFTEPEGGALPPCEGWDIEESERGIDPPPILLYRAPNTASGETNSGAECA
jgi:BTB/POZ domain